MQKKYPKISCLCPTRGRFETLKESISFFLLQDYPNKELIIFNNHPTDLVPHPKLAKHNIKVINAGDYGDSTITEIYRDALASISEDAEYVAVWDDDDVYFPWHLSDNMDLLQKANKPAIRSRCGFWQHQPNITITFNTLEASMIVRKDLIFFNPLLDKEKTHHPHLNWLDRAQKTNSFAFYENISAMFRWSYGRQSHHLQSVGPHKNNDTGNGHSLKPTAVDHIYYNVAMYATSDFKNGIEVCIDRNEWFAKFSKYNIDKFNHLKYKVWLFWDGEHLDKLPYFYNRTIESIKTNTFCDVNIVNDENRKSFIPDVPESYDQFLPAIKADFLRIALLKKFGGYWMDCDTIIYGDLDEYYFRHLTKYQTVFHWEHDIRPHVICALLSSQPNSAVITKAFSYINDYIKTNKIPGWGHLGTKGIIQAVKDLVPAVNEFKLFGLKGYTTLRYTNDKYKSWQFENLRKDLNIIVLHGSTLHELLAMTEEGFSKENVSMFLDKCINEKYSIA